MNYTHQALVSVEFSRQEYCSGLPFPTPNGLSFPTPFPTKSLIRVQKMIDHGGLFHFLLLGLSELNTWTHSTASSFDGFKEICREI